MLQKWSSISKKPDILFGSGSGGEEQQLPSPFKKKQWRDLQAKKNGPEARKVFWASGLQPIWLLYYKNKLRCEEATSAVGFRKIFNLIKSNRFRLCKFELVSGEALFLTSMPQSTVEKKASACLEPDELSFFCFETPPQVSYKKRLAYQMSGALRKALEGGRHDNIGSRPKFLP